MEKRQLNILLASTGTLAIVAVLLLGSAVHTALFKQQATKAIASTPAPDPFLGLKLEAKAAIVYDVERNEVLYGRASEVQLPLASITKTMTALVARELMPPATIVNVGPEALAEEGDSGLQVGEDWRLSELIKYTLVTSSNDGAKAIALGTEALTGRDFVAQMNKVAQTLGLQQTYFRNATGLDLTPQEPGAMGSAYDTAKLFSYILSQKPELLAATESATVSATSFNRAYHGLNTNSLAATLPGIIGSKTGYTNLAGGNLAVVVDIGLRQPIIVVVLGSSQEGRFRDVKALTGAAIRALEIRENNLAE